MSDKHTPTPSAFKLPLTLHCSPSPVINDGSKTLIGMGNWLNQEQAAEIVEAVNTLPLLRECEEALIHALRRNHEPSTGCDGCIKAEEALSRLREARESKSQ